MDAERPAPDRADVSPRASWAIAAELACRELVLRAAACIDAGDAAGLARLFTDDADLVRPGGVSLRGREAIEHAYRDRASDRLTAHLIFGTLFDELGPAAARARSRVLLWTANAQTEPGPHGRLADPKQRVGSFHDTFVLTAQGWRIAERHARFDLFRD